MRREEADAAIRALAAAGIPIRRIGQRLDHSRKVVRAVLRGERTDVFRVRQSSLDAYLPWKRCFAAIRFEHVAFADDGLRLFLAKSKGDQEREGDVVAVPADENPETCPAAALRRWMTATPADSFVFRAVRADGTVLDDGLHPDSVGGSLRSARPQRVYRPGRGSGCPLTAFVPGSSPKPIAPVPPTSPSWSIPGTATLRPRTATRLTLITVLNIRWSVDES